MWSRASEIRIGAPSRFPCPVRNPISSSMSTSRLGSYTGVPSPARTCPRGRRTGVPLLTMVPDRPWYAIGTQRQFGSRGSWSGRNIRPMFVACSREE
jgi:hypothetical protein